MLLRCMLLRSTEWYLEQHVWSTEDCLTTEHVTCCADRKIAGNHIFPHSSTSWMSRKCQATLSLLAILTQTCGPRSPRAQLAARLRLIFCKSSPRKHHVNLGFKTWHILQVCRSMCILGKLGKRAMSFSRKCCPRSKCSWQRANAYFTNTLACSGGK